MKSLHCVYNKKCFANQYTLDLDGFMTPHEFASTINTFNAAAWHYPPPSPIHRSTSVLFLLLGLLLIATTAFLIQQTHRVSTVLALPLFFLLCSMAFILYRRRQKQRFEDAIIQLCKCMNATENVRGINFRLSYLNAEQNISAQPTYSYAITIEFDDRYNLLHHFTNATGTVPPSYASINISPPTYSLTKPSNTYQPSEKQLS
ncbi:hypothetical protein EDC96DRAFT_520510 [Choanephora cucurbitarum]|nr:hypothetical protein EDC96DRAFT_520510 [Choanephora cucurbitarum]